MIEQKVLKVISTSKFLFSPSPFEKDNTSCTRSLDLRTYFRAQGSIVVHNEVEKVILRYLSFFPLLLLLTMVCVMVCALRTNDTTRPEHTPRKKEGPSYGPNTNQ